jgi:TetR/AcrR family transcriptional regulator, transcriptional repressor for nem operon
MRPKGVEKGETIQRILDVATELIQTRGYSAISYHDIAERLGIRKASIHYYFPGKADLGKAVVERYRDAFKGLLDMILADPAISTTEALRRYCDPFRSVVLTRDRVCLCAALAGEILAMPEDMQATVEDFFNTHQCWIKTILERGLARGDITLRAPAGASARQIFSTLQGAVLVCRATHNTGQFDDALAATFAGLANA